MTALKDTVRDLKARAEDHRANARKLDAAVGALQDTCEHEWEESGYDPRGGGTTWSRCKVCLKEKTE